MFWAKARRTYAGVTSDDQDVQKFLELSADFQRDVYKGTAGHLQDLERLISSNITAMEDQIIMPLVRSLVKENAKVEIGKVRCLFKKIY